MPDRGDVPLLQQGDFVWCAFREREAPLRPGPIHVAYTLAVAVVGEGYGVMTAYITGQPWAGALPQGVTAFDGREAAVLGQARAFVLDLRRTAYLPPRRPGSRMQGRKVPGCSVGRRECCEIE